MPNLDRSMLPDLSVFLTIVRRGSMAKAAIELGVTTSALSHRLRKLEEELGVRLLNRTSRAMTLTDHGAALAEDLGAGFKAIEDALSRLQGHRDRPAGTLRLNMLRDAIRLVLGPVITEFSKHFPDIHLDVCADDRFVDIVSEGFDAGIRYGNRVAQDMIAVALTKPLSWVVVGSPSLIEREGKPLIPKQLLAMSCIRMKLGDHSNLPWELGNGASALHLNVKGPLTANETDHAVDAAIRGLGFAYCLERRVVKELQAGDLTVVLPEWASEGPPFSIYYPSRRQMPAGLRELIDLIRENNGLPPLLSRS